MTESESTEQGHTLAGRLLSVVLPAIPFGLCAGHATGDYLAASVTGLVMAGTVQILTELDQTFLHPRLKRFPLRPRMAMEIAFGTLYYVLGLALALFVCTRIFHFAVEEPWGWLFVVVAFVTFVLVHAATYALHFHRALKEKEVQTERLRTLTAQAELKALKAQINPHFLFNTLNTIASLIAVDPAQAEAVVERLAEMLRYVLAGTEGGRVPLREELAFVDGYLGIEQARFGERLRVAREIEPATLDALVPTLILQPLVENAVQHGQAADGSVNLTLRALSRANEIVVVITDEGPGMPPSSKGKPPSGVGLANVDERLRRVFGDSYGLEVSSPGTKGTTVTVQLPIDRTADARAAGVQRTRTSRRQRGQ